MASLPGQREEAAALPSRGPDSVPVQASMNKGATGQPAVKAQRIGAGVGVRQLRGGGEDLKEKQMLAQQRSRERHSR